MKNPNSLFSYSSSSSFRFVVTTEKKQGRGCRRLKPKTGRSLMPSSPFGRSLFCDWIRPRAGTLFFFSPKAAASSSRRNSRPKGLLLLPSSCCCTTVVIFFFCCFSRETVVVVSVKKQLGRSSSYIADSRSSTPA